MKKPTIYTLAQELGTSPSTVSRALNNSPKISESRRRAIKELASRRGFKLRDFSPRLTNLCVLICTGTNDETIFSDYTDQVINGVNRYCNEQDLELSIYSSPREKLNSIDVVKELFRRNVDGVIILNANSKCNFIEQIEKEKLPCCCLLSGNPQIPNNILSVNNQTPARKAVEYLIQLGHRHIGFLYSAPNNQAQLDRLEGYKSALQAAGIPLKEEYIPEMPTSPETTGIEYGFQAATRLTEESPEITALFAASTDLAAGARSAFYRKGLSVPEDISLIGCDDNPHAEYFCPPLTVVDIPNIRLGQSAATWLHRKIEGDSSAKPPQEPWMEGRLIIRETTAPPHSE
ncbi:LacI family DNA-binding transcriptional regulator [Tichowtungia aerotolerans]|uniref:Substrate-binding domain-containing protein n=1 Tax=Tichowtungia aerotolerans TaxID=2697043 RepID=A0A6P1MBA9_9BACT|nr:LacI family DNA-binding transcriptional regulator [Tichowtungia aerotolerans]QHI68846.1 substrate-binding domain-containing protein [Tichowtungia aerotolerans]